LVAIIVVGVLTMRINELEQHLNAVSSFKVGPTWRTFLMYVTSVILTFTLLSEVSTLLDEGYGGYQDNQVFTWGWLLIIVMAVVGAAMHARRPVPEKIPGPRRHPGFGLRGTRPGGRGRGVRNPLAGAAPAATSALKSEGATR
jgi:NSS family neurotransmitter:Na+ symporter